MLAKISIGWVWLERTLNGIIDTVNQQKPIGSASIAIEESPNGTLLKVIPAEQAAAPPVVPIPPPTPPSPTSQYPPNPPKGYAGWYEIAIYDVEAVSVMYIWYFGTGPAFTP
jgi:hypothetical protein